MDNDNFEKQFKRNIKATSSVLTTEKTTKSGIYLVIMAIMAVVILVESIVLAIVINNYFNLANELFEDPGEIYSIEDEYDDGEYESNVDESDELDNLDAENNEVDETDEADEENIEE